LECEEIHLGHPQKFSGFGLWEIKPCSRKMRQKEKYTQYVE